MNLHHVVSRFFVLFLITSLSLILAPSLEGYSAQIKPNQKSNLEFTWQKISKGAVHLRFAQQKPLKSVKTVGDIFYFTGYADRIDNHGPLYDEWTRLGFRVITFDYPQHGLSKGSLNRIDLWGFTSLAKLAGKALKWAEQKEVAGSDVRDRPLIIAGMSVGGLMAIRTYQNQKMKQAFGSTRQPVARISFSPGLSAPVLPWNFGDGRGNTTVKTMTRHPSPPYAGPPRPKNAWLESPIFGLAIGKAGRQAHRETFSDHSPILVFSGDLEDDTIVDQGNVREWVHNKRVEDGADIVGVACKKGRHDLSNEIEPMGQEVRIMAGRYVAQAVTGKIDQEDVIEGIKTCQLF